MKIVLREACALTVSSISGDVGSVGSAESKVRTDVSNALGESLLLSPSRKCLASAATAERRSGGRVLNRSTRLAMYCSLFMFSPLDDFTCVLSTFRAVS